ncbi:hypothetical protein KEM48_008868 [Puccinia striiformis f. sp. tritici PST-130]|nr:hypothetical protein KEM48_008868 [Puccinia striiformis f. sp. tritici PST-130]
MQSNDLEPKELAYLYLMNYAKSHPDLDTEDPNSSITVLSIQTMGLLQAERILDYVCDPLRKCLQDDNPEVQKTAAIGVEKLYDLKPSLALKTGFVDQLKEMVADSNPMSAIANNPSEGDFILDSAVILKLLVALGECTEWGGIALLGAIAKYRAQAKSQPTVQYMSYGKRNMIVDLDIVPQSHIVWWLVYIRHTRLLLDIGSRPVEIIIPSHVFNPACLPSTPPSGKVNRRT